MYNSTILQIDGKTRQVIGVHLGNVDDQGRLIASTWMQKTGLEGSSRYERFLATTGCSFQVIRDGGRLFFETVGMNTAGQATFAPHDS